MKKVQIDLIKNRFNLVGCIKFKALFILSIVVCSFNASILSSDISGDSLTPRLMRLFDWERIISADIIRTLWLFDQGSVMHDFVEQENRIIDAQYQENLRRGASRQEALTNVCTHLDVVRNILQREHQLAEVIRRSTTRD